MLPAAPLSTLNPQLSTDAPPSRDQWAVVACGATISIMIALCAARVLDLINGGNWTQGTNPANFFAGHAGFQVFQNRFLTPAIAAVIQHAFGMTGADAIQTTCEIGLYLASLSVYFGVRKRASMPTAVGAVVAAMFLIVSLTTHNQGHLEDMYDVAILAWFVYLMYYSCRWTAFLPVFAIQMLNKEYGLLIAVWIGLSAFRRGQNVNVRQLATGIILFAIGVAFVHWSRSVFYHGSLNALAPTVGGQWWTFSVQPWNLAWMIPNRPAVILSALALICTPLLLKRHIGDRFAPVMITNLLMLAAICCFGWVGEQRVWIETIPFTVIPLAIYMHNQTMAAR